MSDSLLEPSSLRRWLGVLMAAFLMPWAFPNVGIGVFAVASIAVFLLSIRGCAWRRAALMGAVYGIAWGLVSLRWAIVISPIAWWGLTALLATWMAVFAAGAVVLMRHRYWPVAVGFWWIAVEQLRCLAPWGGFPWLRLSGVGGLDSALPLAWLLSVNGISGVIAGLGAAIAATIISPPRARSIIAPVAIVLGVVVLVNVSIAIQGSAHTTKIIVGYVQPSQPRDEIYTAGERNQVFSGNLNGITSAGAEVTRIRAELPGLPAVLALSEDSVPGDVWEAGAHRNLLQRAIDHANIATLVGVVSYEPGGQHLRNQVVLWQPSVGFSPATAYDKRHLVPFGEFVPLRKLTSSWAAKLATVAVDFRAGSKPGRFTTAQGVRVGTVLCFETAYDDVTRDVIDSDVLAVQTNNGAFLGTEQPEQQYQISKGRAAEAGRPLVVAAATGVSGIVDNRGRTIEGTVAVDNSAKTQVRVVAAGGFVSPARYTSPVLRWGSVIWACLAFAWWGYQGRRRRSE